MTWLAIGRWLLRALRWLFGSKEGRIALLVVVSVAVFLEYGHRRYSAGRAAAVAECAAATARTQANAADQAVKRDTTSDTATQTARQSAADRSVDQNTRAARVEGIAHESRPPVPAVCPGPDPRLVRESQSATARIHAAEDRLRGIGRAEGGKPH